MTKLQTPWGLADHVEEVAPGIKKVHTPGHGGLKLNRATNAAMPPALRQAGGWYEEDCEWAKVAVVFPEAFSEEVREIALKTLKNYFPDAYEAWSGKVLPPGESRSRDEQEFYKAHSDEWIVFSASSGSSWDPVPEGFIKVTAAPGGRPGNFLPKISKSFLVPKDEYSAACSQNKFAPIFDPEKYQEAGA